MHFGVSPGDELRLMFVLLEWRKVAYLLMLAASVAAFVKSLFLPIWSPSLHGLSYPIGMYNVHYVSYCLFLKASISEGFGKNAF